MKTRSTIVALFLVAVFGGLAQAGEINYAAKEYSHNKVTVNATKIWLKKNKIWFKLTVINGTDKLLIFDKEQIQAKTPDGRTFARARSVFAGTAKPVTINPGMSAPLWVEYEIGEMPLEVSLLFSHGFVLDGKPIALPDFVVDPVGK
jgi:hypothetical protein